MAILNVVNDPGHYGYDDDSGAVGPKGTYERNNTYAIGKKVDTKLKRHKEISSWMTRQPGVNYNIHTINQDLDQRCSYANDKYDATIPHEKNIVVSYHCNDSGEKSAAYIASYIYDLGGPAERLAKLIQAEMVAAVDFEKFGFEDAGVKVANFQMVRETEAPAVLVEMGFMSNPGEEMALASEEYREKFAEAIYRGICKYAGIVPLNADGGKIMEPWEQDIWKSGIDMGIIEDGKHQPHENANKMFVVGICVKTALYVTNKIKQLIAVQLNK